MSSRDFMDPSEASNIGYIIPSQVLEQFISCIGPEGGF